MKKPAAADAQVGVKKDPARPAPTTAAARPAAGAQANGTRRVVKDPGVVRDAGSASTGDWRPQLRAKFVTEIAGGTRRAAALLDVAPSQPSRWVSGESVPGLDQARMLVDIDHVLAHALLVWADAGVARDWLTTANANLDGARPVDWIRRHGTADVVEALRMEAGGAYA